ncbi:MAG: DUF481 domain-containing protein [Pseudomonadota bacterium]
MRHFLIVFLCLLSSPALADTLFLHNGDKFSGQITDASNPGALEFDAAFGQSLNVPWESIAGLYDSSGQPVPFPVKEVPVVAATPQTVNPQVNITESASVEDIQSEAVEEEPKIWSGRVNVGLGLQTGNTETEAINADAELKARWNDAHRSTFMADVNFEEDNGETTEDNRMIGAEHDYFFIEDWFLNARLSFEQDDIDQIDLRSVAGLGLGHQVYEGDDLNLQYVLGPSYLREDFENGDTENSIAGRWAFDYDQRIFGDILQLFHDHELLVPTDDTDDFLFDSQTGIRVPLKAGLVGTAEVDFEWDNKPEDGNTEDDTEYSLKLGYEW